MFILRRSAAACNVPFERYDVMSFSSLRRFALRLAALVTVSIAAGFALLLLVNCLPKEPIAENVRLSAFTLREEGQEPTIDTINGPLILDNLTASIMLSEAAYIGDRGILEHTVASPQLGLENMEVFDSFVHYYTDPPGTHGEPITYEYFRYWHGYLVYLRPLLFFFNLDQVRVVYLIVQAALAALMFALMIRRGLARFVPAFLLSIALLTPLLIAYSLQYSSVYFVALVGCATSYVDFLTAPLMTLYFPLALFFCLNPGSVRQNLLRFVAICACWAVGYIGMWAGKWLLVTLFLHKNGFLNAYYNIAARSSYVTDGESITYGEVLGENWACWSQSPLHIVVLILLAVCIVLVLRRRAAGRLPASLSAFVPVALLPFAWYMVTSNHSLVHACFTYRALGALPLALLCAVLAPLSKHAVSRR